MSLRDNQLSCQKALALSSRRDNHHPRRDRQNDHPDRRRLPSQFLSALTTSCAACRAIVRMRRVRSSSTAALLLGVFAPICLRLVMGRYDPPPPPAKKPRRSPARPPLVGQSDRERHPMTANCDFKAKHVTPGCETHQERPNLETPSQTRRCRQEACASRRHSRVDLRLIVRGPLDGFRGHRGQFQVPLAVTKDMRTARRL